MLVEPRTSWSPLLLARNLQVTYLACVHWFSSVQELAEDWGKAVEHIVDWSAFGCDKTAADSTIWLGTEGSHTPLHYDTYGINLVRCFSFPFGVLVRFTGKYHRESSWCFKLWAAHACKGQKRCYVPSLILSNWVGDGYTHTCLKNRAANRASRWPSYMAKRNGCSTPPLKRPGYLPPAYPTRRAVYSVV